MTTRSFKAHDGVVIAFHEWNDSAGGVPVVLHHGFAADTVSNWVTPSIVAKITETGRRVISIDARGHGLSGKPTESAAYADGAMVRDLGAMFDHLGLERVDLVGYSMGGYVVLDTATSDARLRSVVIGGIGAQAIEGGMRSRAHVADALVVDDAATISDPIARGFREFAESTGGDRFALAAAMRAGSRVIEHPERVTVPALVLVGEFDELVQRPEDLAARIPGSCLVRVRGTHNGVVLKDAFAQAILDFLTSVQEL